MTRHPQNRASIDAVPFGATPDVDPRVEALVDWAQRSSEPLDETGSAGLAALEDSPPRPRAASALAFVAAAAYARVPTIGPRDLQTGHRIVGLLGELGEAGVPELVRLRERIRYVYARRRISKVLGERTRELGRTAEELEDLFDGPSLDGELAMRIGVGSCVARLHVSGDLRRVTTSWVGTRGRPVHGRPAQTSAYPRELEHVASERVRLRSHLGDLRNRLERAMTTGRSWSLESWTERMFAEPLRATMARRLIWRVEEMGSLAMPEADGLRDADGHPVRLPASTNLSIWHPADSAIEQRLRWQKRLATLAIVQPIDQAGREVTAADPESPILRAGTGALVRQRRLRGYLTSRGWHVPYLGRWFEVPEATFELQPGGPVAVLDLTVDDEEKDMVAVGELHFRSVQDEPLDARLLPPALVSDAARDVLGAVAAGRSVNG